VLVLVVMLALGRPGPPLSDVASARLPGVRTTDAPWASNTAQLPARLAELDLPGPGVLEHVHAFVALVIHGRRVPVPGGIGLSDDAEASLHVHDGDPGIVHVETWWPFWRPTLGRFFDVWGVRLTSSCIGGYCDGAAGTLSVFVNGRAFDADPRTVPLLDRERIVVTFGTEAEVPDPLPTYDWSSFDG
jgi:hypothetical protein